MSINQQKKVLVATYRVESIFKIPKDIDLEAEGVKYVVIRDLLHITLPCGKELEVEATVSGRDVELVVPADYKIINNDECEHCDECLVCGEDKIFDEEGDLICERCEEEGHGQNCRRCQTFIPDGQEYVAEGDENAYCRICFPEFMKEKEEDEDSTIEQYNCDCGFKHNVDEDCCVSDCDEENDE